MVQVAYAKIREPSPIEFELLPDAERRRVFRSDRRRREFLSGRLLLRRLLERWNGEPAAGQRLLIEAGGKPVCVGGPAISISHAGNYVACAFSEAGGIGIDIERAEDRISGPRIARRFFTRVESKWLESQPPDRFVMLWVLKEAYVKVLGRSIFDGLAGLSVTVVAQKINVHASAEPMRAFGLYSVEDCYLGLATSTEPVADLQIEYWNAETSTFDWPNAVMNIAGSLRRTP